MGDQQGKALSLLQALKAVTFTILNASSDYQAITLTTFKAVSCCSSPLLPILQTWINFIPTWISNDMPSKVWDESIYPFPNFNGTAIEVWEWISNFIPHFAMDVIAYPCW